MNNDGKIDDVYYADYQAPTGLTLTAGQSVTVSYYLTANSKTDDGFGNTAAKYGIVSHGNNSTPPTPGADYCTITGQ